MKVYKFTIGGSSLYTKDAETGVDIVFPDIDKLDGGEKMEISVEDMTQEEIDELPEFGGF